MAQAQHTTFVLALTLVFATALAASSLAQNAGRGNSPGGGPGRNGPGMETSYPGNDNCPGTRCDNQQRKPKPEHSDRCSPTVTNGKPTPQDCHPQLPPKP